MDLAVSDFRQQLAGCLHRVEQGEEIVIRRSGKAIAKLVPIDDPREAAAARLREAAKHCWVGDVISPIDDPWDADQDGPL